MKKVRYLTGVVGAAPVLGLITPPGSAGAAVTHAPAANGKTVSLTHVQTRPLNVGGCRNSASLSPRRSADGLSEFIRGTPGASCIAFVSGRLGGRHLNLDMRTRYYSYGGKKIGDDHFNPAQPYSPAFGITSWTHTTTVDAWQACIALVLASNHNSKKYGPVCLSI